MPAPKARTRHTQYTAEYFNELAAEGLAEMIENNPTLEMKSLAEWTRELTRHIGRVSDHRTSSDPAPMGDLEGVDDIFAGRLGD